MSHELSLFVPITKVDADKRLVYGVATGETKDHAGEICDYASTKPFYEKWSSDQSAASGGKSLGNLRAMHDSVAAGKLTAINFNDDEKQIEIVAKVVDDSEWNKVLDGVYTGFSQGGKYVARWKDDDGNDRYTASPVEVSLVDIPCLSTATFKVVKADGTIEKRGFKMATAPTNEQIAARATELAKAAGDATKWPGFIEAASKELTKSVDANGATTTHDKPQATVADGHEGNDGNHAQAQTGNPNPGGAYNVTSKDKDGKDVSTSHATQADADAEADKRKANGHSDVYAGQASNQQPGGGSGPDNPQKAALANGVKQVWVAADSDIGHAKKADALADLAKAAAAAEVNEATAPARAALDAIEKALGLKKAETVPDGGTVLRKDDSSDNKKPYGDVDYADPGHQDDGKARYPVDTPKHIRAAWSYINKPSNQKPYTAEQVDSIKAKIIAAWKEKIDADGPPDAATKAFKNDNLAKGLYTVGCFAEILERIAYLQQSAQYEETYEQDDSTMPASLKSWLSTGAQLLRDMVTEETGELFTGPGDVDVILEADCLPILECAWSGDRSGQDALIKFVEGNKTELAKSKGGAKTDKILALLKSGARNSAADLKKIQEVHDHSAALGATCAKDNCGEDMDGKSASVSDLAKAAAENESLKKDLGAMSERLDGILKALESNTALVQKVANTPLPLPFAGTARTVSKGQDVGGGQDDTAVMSEILKTKEGRDAVATMFFKAAQAQGVHRLPDLGSK